MSNRQRIAAVLRVRFCRNEVAQTHFRELLADYADSELSSSHLVAEIETADEGKLYSYIWEAMLYRHLCSLGYTLQSATVTTSGQHGPDFCVDCQGRTIWIEAIVPSPEGIPSDWLEPAKKDEFRVKTKPDQQRVLRCTSAIGAKQKKFAEYRAKGIVAINDCTVIAVNICRLSEWDVDGNGISQLPLVMEAVFPIGPLGVPITKEGELRGPMQHVTRLAVQKVNGAEIPTANFLNPLFGNVSAVMQGHQNAMFRQNLILSTVHNPLAHNPLPVGLFGARKEFVAEPDGDGYQVTDVASKS